MGFWQFLFQNQLFNLMFSWKIYSMWVLAVFFSSFLLIAELMKTYCWAYTSNRFPWLIFRMVFVIILWALPFLFPVLLSFLKGTGLWWHWETSWNGLHCRYCPRHIASFQISTGIICSKILSTRCKLWFFSNFPSVLKCDF